MEASGPLMALVSTRPQGATVDELESVFGRRGNNISSLLSDCARRGLLVWVSEPKGRAPHRRRYFAMAFAPEVHGEATMKKKTPPKVIQRLDSDAAVIEPPGVRRPFVPMKPDPRFHVELPPGYQSSLSSAECRPWALAAGERS